MTMSVSYHGQHQRTNQFRMELSRDIVSGTFALLEQLPSERLLSSIYGVARGTVSKVLQEWIKMEILSRQGYRLRIDHARAVALLQPVLKDGQRLQVAVMFPREDEFSLGIVEGILAYCEEFQQDCNLFMNPGLPAGFAPVNLLNGRIDGVIAMPHEHLEVYMKHCRRRNLPMVLIDSISPDGRVDTVTVDNFGGAYRAVNRLLARYKKPVHCFGFGIQDAAAERFRGYSKAMQDAGFADVIQECTHFYRYEDLMRHYERHRENEAINHLKQLTPPSVIFALNDYAAYSIYAACMDLGWQVGREVKLFGFDDLPMAYSLNPRLSSVRQPRQSLGYESARLLHRRLLAPELPSRQTVLPVTLVEKESSR